MEPTKRPTESEWTILPYMFSSLGMLACAGMTQNIDSYCQSRYLLYSISLRRLSASALRACIAFRSHLRNTKGLELVRLFNLYGRMGKTDRKQFINYTERMK